MGTIYVLIFIDQDPNSVWSKIGILQRYTGDQLFGLIHQYTQNLIQAARVPFCTLDEWHNKEVITKVYNYHLRRRISVEINWHNFFTIG